VHILNKKNKVMFNTIINIELTLEQFYFGYQSNQTVSRQRFCDLCHGTGAHTFDDLKKCDHCEGTGLHLYLKEGDNSFAHAVNTTCRTCNGYGKVILNKCQKCSGQRVSVLYYSHLIICELTCKYIYIYIYIYNYCFS
jgi:molecular chaperone DnaJ